MQLLDCERIIGAGALIAKATVRLPIGLVIADIGIFRRDDGTRWAQMPSEPMRDRDGQPPHDARGKVQYRTSIKWESRELQSRWSDAVLALVDDRLGGGR
jgi:hypothetical protein